MSFVDNTQAGHAWGKDTTDLSQSTPSVPVDAEAAGNGDNFMFGKLFSSAVKLINAPIDATEKLVGRLSGEDDMSEDDKIASAPLRALADALREVDDDPDDETYVLRNFAADWIIRLQSRVAEMEREVAGTRKNEGQP